MKFKVTSFVSLVSLFILTLSSFTNPSLAQGKKMTAEEVVARHLESIGSAEARAAIKTRLVSGQLKFVIRTGSPYQEDTVARIISAGAKFRYTALWPQILRDRKEEEILFDGERVATGLLLYQKGQPLSDFFFRFQLPLQEGLVGGVLSTAWPLARMGERQPRLEYRGLKKVEGKQAHALDYRKRKGLADLKITLFFDAETFRHLRTEYLYEIDTTFGADAPDSSRAQAVRQQLVEEFGDFRAVDGLTLPHRYRLQLSREGGFRADLRDWELTVQKVSHKEPLDDSLFKAK
ncbi:MAG: hypothetical protein AB1631_05985 [Acidobacteriota bacterium]